MYAALKIQAALSAEGAAPKLSGYAAFPVECADDGQPVAKHIGSFDSQINELKTAWFGDYGWVTLCGSWKDAIKEAVASRGRAAPTAATADTTWVVFRCSLTPHQVTKCFKEKLIEHKETYGLDCWRFYGDLQCSLVDHDWTILRIDKMGFEQWAHWAVGARTRKADKLDRGQCQKCDKHSATTWQAWCAVCWNENHEKAAAKKRRVEDASSSAAGLTAADPSAMTVAIPMEIHSW